MKIAGGKGFIKAAVDSGYSSGALVLYEQDGHAFLGAILKFQRQKYVVFNERGREIELAAIRLYPLPGILPSSIDTLEGKTKHLSALRTQGDACAGGIILADLWGVVCEKDREYSSQELCELYFTDQALVHQLGMRLALIGDKVFFKRGKDGFCPRSASVVEELQRAEQVRHEKLRTQELVIEWVAARLKDSQTPMPREIREYVHLLENVAAGVSNLDNSAHKEAKELLERCAAQLSIELHGSREQRAFALLVKTHHWKPHINLGLYRHRPRIEFGADVLRAADALTVPETLSEWEARAGAGVSPSARRVDLTHLKCFTIDDQSTKDMDDALSLELTSTGFQLGIHISDVASLVPTDSPLDNEAILRATSLYLPGLNIDMFPPAIAHEKASLVANQVRGCLSCLFEVNHELHVDKGTLVPSIITVNRRYGYEEVDAMLEGDAHELHTIYNIGVNLEMRRAAQGALKVFKRDLTIVAHENGDVTLTELDEHGPARGMIGEMMVLANTLIAEYAVQHRVPVVYRLQEPPDNIPESRIPEGPAADYVLRSVLKKSLTSLSPGPHAGLGLKAYLQATSPIRRYIDLCNQRQILEHLRFGRLFYSRQQFERILHETDEPLTTALTLSRESRRYWLLRYLQLRVERSDSRDSSARLIRGTVLRTDLKNPLVELDEVFLPVIVKVDGAVRPGDVLQLRIATVDPHADYLKLEVVSAQPP